MNLQPAVVISVVVTVIGGLALFQPRQYAWIGDQTGYAPVQPIEFSHKLHAKDNSIPCQYCHTGARRGPVAGIPSASTCMNCHSEIAKDSPEVQKVAAALKEGRAIEWVRIHDLPHFTRFDHSVHVAAGVDCQSCHGPVETMTRVEQSRHMSMGWCIQCHRDPGAAQLGPIQTTAAGNGAGLPEGDKKGNATPPASTVSGRDPHAGLDLRKPRASTECVTCHY